MSQENVELVQQMFNAWNRGDYDAARDFFDPDVDSKQRWALTSTGRISATLGSRG